MKLDNVIVIMSGGLMNEKIPTFVCNCERSKPFKLTFDSGSLGLYQIQMCNVCYNNDSREFLVEEVIRNE